MATRFGTNPFERPSLAVGQLLQGQLPLRAVFAPASLSPAERETLADKMGVGQGNRVYDTVIRSITNPLIVAGAVLALRYPIPHAKDMFRYAARLSGEARRLGPILKRVAGVDELYAGTDIPELYKKIIRSVDTFRRTHADKIGQAMVRAEKAGYKIGRREEVLLAAKLDGLDRAGAKGWTIFKGPIQEGPAFQKLYHRMREINNEVWEQVFGTIDKKASLLSKAESMVGQKLPLAVLARHKGNLTRKVTGQLRAQYMQDLGYIRNANRLGKQRDYFPHQLSREMRKEAFERQTTGLIERAQGRERIAGEMAFEAAGRVSSRAALERKFSMVPDPKDLEVVKDLLRPGALGELAKRGMPSYSLRFKQVYSSYIHGLARAWGFSLDGAKMVAPKGERRLAGYGDRLMQAVANIEKNDPVRASWMKDSYIPMALGRLTFRQAMGAAEWAQWKGDMVKALGSKKAKEFIPTGVRDWLGSRLKEDRGLFSMANMGGKVAGYLYLSTLGTNPVSASYNLMQLLLTTVPSIGPKYTMRGLGKVMDELPAYFNARKAGMAHETALQKVFPKFAKEGLAGHPITDEAVQKALNSAWEVSLNVPTELGGKVDRVKRAMMGVFTASENIVRLASFEGAHLKATAEGLKGEAAVTFARRVTEMTQFLGGPANVPAFAREWNPAFRQFLQFPARTVEFILGPGTELGSAAQSGAFSRNPGTLGRMMLTSGLAYEGAKGLLDADVSHGLMFGALPVPNPRMPFSPVPFVPPVIAMGGAVAQDILEGEFDQTRYALPLLVPGGVTMSRMMGFASPEAAKFLGKEWVDYDKALPDGRVPLFTREGSLRGYLTPMQLHMRALGLGGGPEAPRVEEELQKFLLAQRDRIRGYRKEFLEAVADNDTRRATSIREEYKKAYPGMGGLQFEERDLRAVYLRRMVPRLERLLETMPRDAREQFGGVIATALANEAQTLLGVDPILLTQPGSTVRSRDPMRVQQPGSIQEMLHQVQVQKGLALETRGGPRQSSLGGQAAPQSRLALDSISGTTPTRGVFPLGGFTAFRR